VASLALQAALSGHRLLCTLHAGTPGSAIARLLEMGMEPYQITSCLFGVVAQRLLRRKAGEGYKGRVPVAEFARLTPAVRQAILNRSDAETLQQILQQQGDCQTLRQAAQGLVTQQITDELEILRILGH